MNYATEQVIQSSRYLDDKVKVMCVCCQQESFDHSGFCNQCQAPLDLSRTAEKRGLPFNLSRCWEPAARARRCYIGMLLDILSKGSRGIQGLPNNSFSVAIQQQTINALESRRFPEKTPSEADGWQWVHCEVNTERDRNNYLDIITPDFAGEAISTELEHPGTYLAIRSVIYQSRAILMLIDSLAVRDAGRDEDFFAMKLASYIHNLRTSNTKHEGQTKTQVSLRHRADQVGQLSGGARRPDIASPMTICLASVSTCSGTSPNYRFFAASAVGAAAMLVDHRGYFRQIPLHIEPRGITEPLEWIIQNK